MSGSCADDDIHREFVKWIKEVNQQKMDEQWRMGMAEGQEELITMIRDIRESVNEQDQKIERQERTLNTIMMLVLEIADNITHVSKKDDNVKAKCPD